jgi:hypothetical protein
MTFHDSDRDAARAETRCNEDRDVKAWQDEDEDSGARSQR